MKRLSVALIAAVLMVPTAGLAEQIIVTKPKPTKIVGSTWHNLTNRAYNGNLWLNVWPSDGAIGGYGYLQAADGYTQMYGGFAVRRGPIELGLGLGIENADGNVGARQSVYGIVTRGKFQSATWYEHSRDGGAWFLSNNLYGFTPGRFEGGIRFQRYLGAGPMVRMSFPGAGRFQPQIYLAAMYDGDGLNQLIGGAVNF